MLLTTLAIPAMKPLKSSGNPDISLRCCLRVSDCENISPISSRDSHGAQLNELFSGCRQVSAQFRPSGYLQ